MKKRSGILFSIFWNQILWLIPLTAALMSPVLLLAFLGFYWFLIGGHVFWLFNLSVILFFLLLFLVLLIRYFRLPRHFGGKENLQAKEIVRQFSEEMRQTNLTFTDWRKILQKVLELNAKVARAYGIRGKHPEKNIRIHDILLAVESISTEMERFLLNSSFSWLLDWGKLRQVFYFIPAEKKAGQGAKAKKEKKSAMNLSLTFQNEENEEAGKPRQPGMLGKWVYQPVLAYFFKCVGEYSIRINSGNLCYQAEAGDSWKYPLKISITDWFVRQEKEVGEKWLERLRENSREYDFIQEQSKNTQKDRVTVSGWGEIFLTRELPSKSMGMAGVWRMARNVFSPVPIPNELLREDLLLLFFREEEAKEILAESFEFQSWSGFFSKRFVHWLEKSPGERPSLVWVFPCEEPEKIDGESLKASEKIRRKIARVLNLDEDEIFVWFASGKIQKSMDAESSATEKKREKLLSVSLGQAALCLPNSENGVIEETRAAALRGAGRQDETDLTENEAGNHGFDLGSTLSDLIKFAESVGEKIQLKKDVSVSAEMKAGARSVQRNRFFASRFVTPRWLLGFYGIVFFGCLVLGGVLFTQEKIANWIFPEEAVSLAETDIPAGEFLKSGENGSVNRTFGQKYGLSILACGMGGICLLVLFLFVKSCVRGQVLEVEPDEYWPLKERETFEKVQMLTDGLKLSEISGMGPIWQTFRGIVELVDQEYSGRGKAQYSISLSEILKAQRILVSRLRQTLDRELPSTDYLLLRDIQFGVFFYRYYLWVFNIYRKILWIDPVSATVLELRRTVNQGVMKFFGKQIAASSILYAMRLAGFYAVEIYSGNLFFQNDREPARLFVTGGKDVEISSFADMLKEKINEFPQIHLTISENRINEEQAWWKPWQSSSLRKCEQEAEYADVVLGIFQNSEEKKLLEQLKMNFQKREHSPLFLFAEENECRKSDFQSELQTFFAQNERMIRLRKNERFLAEYRSRKRRG